MSKIPKILRTSFKYRPLFNFEAQNHCTINGHRCISTKLSLYLQVLRSLMLRLIQSPAQPQSRILEANEGWPKGQKFCPPVSVLHRQSGGRRRSVPFLGDWSILPDWLAWLLVVVLVYANRGTNFLPFGPPWAPMQTET